MTTSKTVSAIVAGTIVVHNYGEFTHGVVMNRAYMPPADIEALNKKYGRDVFASLVSDQYIVFFPLYFCPKSKHYAENSILQYRILTSKDGFFVSKCKSITDVLEKQAQYRKSGAALEGAI